ncbi:unnamed protein product [Polarella glacialis]|uniref:EGF-like domain-containing protein n=1 Tax=Polarella glacialis TaxID=89957 RepID=A0A813FQS2_POLGL|nr:unnamed protein product [Polarella glacialis]
MVTWGVQQSPAAFVLTAALALSMLRRVDAAGTLQGVFAQPMGLQADTEVPIYLSFTTGSNSAYGQADVDDGTAQMMLSFQMTVYCRPEIEPCQYVELGENNNCRKILEAPNLPPIRWCSNGPFGIMTLELRRTLEKNTRYDLLVLGTLPGPGKRIQSVIARTLDSALYLDISRAVPFEEATVPILPEYTTDSPTNKQITAFELVTPPVASQGEMLHQYTFRITGSSVPFTLGDEIRLYASPLIYPDEGLSFGGACMGFDTSGFGSPLAFVSCRLDSIPPDTRVGYNVVVLTFGANSKLNEVPRYFRIALSTPKGQGSIGRWWAASKDLAVLSPSKVFNKVIQASSDFFVRPSMDILTGEMPASADPSINARQKLHLTIFPRVNILGATAAPTTITIVSPTFHEITGCSVLNPILDVYVVGQGADAYCKLSFTDNQNLYAHQSVAVRLEVLNPTFALPAETFQVSLITGDGTMSLSQSFSGWPVYASLKQVFIAPMTVEYAQWNELQVFFRTAATSPPEPRAVIVAPTGYTFEDGCNFDILIGFPAGVRCSNPLSEMGRNLFSLQMPMSTAFEQGMFYAANIYPLRNPYPGSYSGLGALSDLPWRIDITTMSGDRILETTRRVPRGPNLAGFALYPAALLNCAIEPSIRIPLADNVVTLNFELSVKVTSHGERMRITAANGYRWKIGAAVEIKVGDTAASIATLTYDQSYPPVVVPYNQIELTLINPAMPAGSDITVQGTVVNAAIDAELNEDIRSANAWLVELYEPGSGYLQYEYRHQAAIFRGFNLKAITGGSVTAWVPSARATQLPIMVTFRLGSPLFAKAGSGTQAALEITAPQGFEFPPDCAAQRISPPHQPEDGFSALPAGSISSCTGGPINNTAGSASNANMTMTGTEDSVVNRRVALILLKAGTVVDKRLVYSLMLEVVIPGSTPWDNTWRIRSIIVLFGGQRVQLEEQSRVPGFRLATAFLSAVYYPGTEDTGEDLRGGASENLVMFSLQPSSVVPAGGQLQLTAPYRFTFARDCRLSLRSARTILSELEGDGIYADMPPVKSCSGVRNVATVVFTNSLEVAIRYSFRFTVTNPVLPHPAEWPFKQNFWRFGTFDDDGAPLNTAEVTAFFLWAFVSSLVTPLVYGATESSVVTIEIEPSLTVPPLGSLFVAAALGFVLPVPCEGFQRDTFGSDLGFSPLPPQTTCSRGPGGSRVVKLQLDSFSYIAAGVRVRFRLTAVNPSVPTVTAVWSISSAELSETGESYLEQSPAVEGFPVHSRLKSFAVLPSAQLADTVAIAQIEVSVQESLGVFDVVSTTEASFLVVDMPPYFAVPVLAPEVRVNSENSTSSAGITVDSGAEVMTQLLQCQQFTRIYPEPEFFPADADGCLAAPAINSFRVRLTQNLAAGPAYTFSVAVKHPVLTSFDRLKQIMQVNVWQVRLVRLSTDGKDMTFTSRSADGYRLFPLLPNVLVVAETQPLGVGMLTRVTVRFQVVSPLSAAASDSLMLLPPASVLAQFGQGCFCELSVAEKILPSAQVLCEQNAASGGVMMRLAGGAIIPADAQVKVDVQVHSGNEPLSVGQAQNGWTVMTLDVQGTAWDQAVNIPGFTVFPALLDTAVIPKDLAAMSFANFAEFRFTVTVGAPENSELAVIAPAGFVLYPRTFAPGSLPGADLLVRSSGVSQPMARQGSFDGEVIISLPLPLPPLQPFSFRLTIGNPAVSPSSNMWILDVRSGSNQTLAIDPMVEGFVVKSSFNTTLIESEVDEPLAENYVHILIAVSERLSADSFLSKSACASVAADQVCTVATFLEVTAPVGFVFQPTCGYWAPSLAWCLLESGLATKGCLQAGRPAKDEQKGGYYSAQQRVHMVSKDVPESHFERQVSLSLERLQLYEFTLQVGELK